jgi:hypothetical protein
MFISVNPSLTDEALVVKESNRNGTNGTSASADRGPHGRFLPGHSIRTGGRPKGARSKLSENFLQDLHAEWRKSGKKALAKVAETHPEVLVKLMAGLLPKVLEVDASLAIEQRSEIAIAVADFREAYRLIGARPRAALIEQKEPIEEETDE